ncbi:SpoIIE family protein phosphatase [Streptomyces sp. NPDC051322]|uniref:SpoIIE family protein phosphatase n=1 Tax=Streptomyces sp. NPDC051322 TaxID=3154645 RepID=UPI00344B3E05
MSRPPSDDGATGQDFDINLAALETLFSASPVSLYVFDRELRLVRYSPAARDLRGVSPAELLGQPFADVAPGYDVRAIEQVLAHVRDTGEAVVEQEVTGRPLGDPDHEHVMSFSAFRLADAAGRPHGVVALATDVTDRARARARLGLVHAANARIGTSLDAARTARELAEVAVPELADTVTIDVLCSVLAGEAPQSGGVDVGLPLRRLALRAARETDRGIHPVGDISVFGAASPHGQSLADLRPRLVRDLAQDSGWLAQDPARAELVQTAGYHSLMVLPLTAWGVVLGLASFYRWSDKGPFEEDDLTLAAELADRTALCLDNARRYVREHTVADTLQRSLLPPRPPTVTALEAAHCYLSGGAGSDWFDVIPLSGTRVALVVGDVAGQGIQAAAAMGRLRTAIRTLAALDLAPDETLARLDDLVLDLAKEYAQPPHSPKQPPVGATCLYTIYDPISRRCTLARAGHPPPVLVHPNGDVHIIDVPAGPPLGRGSLPFETAELELPEGSMIGLYTNGLLSGQPDTDTALLRLQRMLSTAGPSLQDTCTTALHTLLPSHPLDDAVLLLARTRTLQPDHVTSWTLPTDPAIVATARTLTSRQLDTWQFDDLAFTAELVVSELVTNAIRYAKGPLTLRLIHDRTLICEVSDHSNTAPQLRHVRTTDEGGRGLFLVAHITQRWGTRYTTEGKTIWAELPHSQPTPAPDPETLASAETPKS